MGVIIKIVLCLCANLIYVNAYKAGALRTIKNDLQRIVYEAGEQNLDILVLPSDIDQDNGFDEVLKTLSKAAKQANLYLVAHLKENIRCQNQRQVLRSNVVFDRKGAIIADYRKPLHSIGNCTKTSSEPATFITDFGVKFTLMMEEDLVLRTPQELLGKNFVVTGDWSSEMQFLKASQFYGSWSYINNVNLVTPNGIYAGRSGSKASEGFMMADLKNDVEVSKPNPPVIDTATLQSYPSEDLSQYSITPLDVEASSKGYKKTVCHNNFCCEFDVKSAFRGSYYYEEVSYGLAAFNGIRHYGGNQYIGVQNCAVFACAGLYKKTCSFGSLNNNTDISFERLSVSANFSKQTAQYPVILSNHLTADRFSFSDSIGTKKHVTVQLSNSDSILTFGIFGRDYAKDYESPKNKDGGDYDNLFTEDLQEWFDYLWIRIRILFFVVSIYVLEML